MTRTQFFALVGWLGVSFAAAAVGGYASVQAASFYAALFQPGWAPPPWLFGPVWSLLYTMMGVAAWLVWRQGGFSANRAALILFLVQLAVNAAWTWTFFGWQMGALALVNIVVLWVLIALTLTLFWRVRVVAGALLIPYLAWVSFAGVLNLSLWQLNPGILGQGVANPVHSDSPEAPS